MQIFKRRKAREKPLKFACNKCYRRQIMRYSFIQMFFSLLFVTFTLSASLLNYACGQEEDQKNKPEPDVFEVEIKGMSVVAKDSPVVAMYLPKYTEKGFDIMVLARLDINGQLWTLNFDLLRERGTGKRIAPRALGPRRDSPSVWLYPSEVSDYHNLYLPINAKFKVSDIGKPGSRIALNFEKMTFMNFCNEAIELTNGVLETNISSEDFIKDWNAIDPKIYPSPEDNETLIEAEVDSEPFVAIVSAVGFDLGDQSITIMGSNDCGNADHTMSVSFMRGVQEEQTYDIYNPSADLYYFIFMWQDGRHTKETDDDLFFIGVEGQARANIMSKKSSGVYEIELVTDIKMSSLDPETFAPNYETFKVLSQGLFRAYAQQYDFREHLTHQ